MKWPLLTCLRNVLFYSVLINLFNSLFLFLPHLIWDSSPLGILCRLWFYPKLEVWAFIITLLFYIILINNFMWQYLTISITGTIFSVNPDCLLISFWSPFSKFFYILQLLIFSLIHCGQKTLCMVYFLYWWTYHVHLKIMCIL